MDSRYRIAERRKEKETFQDRYGGIMIDGGLNRASSGLLGLNHFLIISLENGFCVLN